MMCQVFVWIMRVGLVLGRPLGAFSHPLRAKALLSLGLDTIRANVVGGGLAQACQEVCLCLSVLPAVGAQEVGVTRPL